MTERNYAKQQINKSSQQAEPLLLQTTQYYKPENHGNLKSNIWTNSYNSLQLGFMME
jgi:hypothetical protein